MPDVAGGNPFAGDTGLGGSNTGATASDDTGDEDEVTERRESDSLLTQTYEIAALRGSPVKVQAFKVLEGKHPNGFYVKPRGPALEFHYWPDSKIFKETLLTPADMLINELAVQMHTAAQKEIGEIPISKVELGLREQYFPELQPSETDLKKMISAFTDELRQHLINRIENGEMTPEELLTQKDLSDARDKIIELGITKEDDIQRMITSGAFLEGANIALLGRLVVQTPELVFDGDFFEVEL